jgi:hypothetical protein
MTASFRVRNDFALKDGNQLIDLSGIANASIEDRVALAYLSR